MATSINLDVVSAQESLFHGQVAMISVTGTAGELGILPGHTPLLASLKPGQVELTLPSEQKEFVYISGGMIEVQKNIVTILADTAIRAEDIDEVAVKAAKEKAEKMLEDKQSELEYAQALVELAEAVAQLKVVHEMKKKRN